MWRRTGIYPRNFEHWQRFEHWHSWAHLRIGQWHIQLSVDRCEVRAVDYDAIP